MPSVETSPLLFYAAAAKVGASPNRSGDSELRVPEVFSFIDDPEGTLRTIERFVRMVRSGVRTVRVNQRQCTRVELCAETVLNALARDAKLRHGVSFRGLFPINRQALDIVLATGLPGALGMDVPKVPNFFIFGTRHRGGVPVSLDSRSSPSETIAREVTEYLDQCLDRVGFRLTVREEDQFNRLITEVLNNAERHAAEGQIGDWYLSSYLHLEDGEPGDCHLTIFNFGRTIAETLRTLPPEATLRQQISALADQRGAIRHRQRTRDNVWTVAALQEGVSRYNRESGDELGGRGHGTVDMIEAFQELGRCTIPGVEPRMCVVSGTTCVHFDGRYRMLEKEFEGGGRKVIAFNPENDLRLSADPTAVRTLENYFPGTLISLRFFLDPAYLSSIATEE